MVGVRIMILSKHNNYNKQNDILEIGMKLNKDLLYYHELLLNHNLNLVYSCVTHDIYYTKDDLNGLSENEMKNLCIRIRHSHELKNTISSDEISSKEKELIDNGYTKIFDTIKLDFHYANNKMKSRIQLQYIKDIGLLVYYDNPNYYKYPISEQRKLLINELNSYGFNFKETDLGLDKLRTLYYGKEMFSENQNA